MLILLIFYKFMTRELGLSLAYPWMSLDDLWNVNMKIFLANSFAYP